MNTIPGRRHTFLFTALFAIMFTGLTASQTVTQQEADSYLKNLPFAMKSIKLPSFPEKYYDITKYGAKGDGITKNTQSIQKAIDECSLSGGGYVIIPSGFWLTGPLSLKNNINLHLEKGAMIVFSGDHNDFPLVKIMGKSGYTCPNPLLAEGIENAAITGDGIINGNGQTWRPVKKSKMTESQWKNLLKSGGALNKNQDMWWPNEKAALAEEFLAGKKVKEMTLEDYTQIKDFYRPHMLYMVRCKNILLDGPTFQNSPNFALYITKSENAVVGNVKVNNEWFAQNGDGIDFSACKNVLIYKCTVNAGDDGICIKSSKSGKSSTVAEMQNVVIADCVVYHAHGGFVIGSNTDGGIKNVFVNNCNFSWTDTGLRFKSGRGRGGLIEDIYIQNIFMKDIQDQAIIFDNYYEDKGAAKTMDQKEKTDMPLFRNIHINNLICDQTEEAVFIHDLPESGVKDIDINNSVIISEKGFSSIGSENIKLNNVNIITKKFPVFSILNGKNITLDNIKFNPAAKQLIKLSGEKTQNVKLTNTETKTIDKPFEFSDGAASGSLIVN